MKLTIYRGTHEIGGTCIEVVAGKTRILLDFGMPLSDDNGEAIDEKIFSKNSVTELIKKKWLYPIKGLYKNETPEINAILISHSHKDHYGLLQFAHPDIPVYMSEEAEKLIGVLNVFLREDCCFKLPAVQHVYHKKPFEIGDLRIIPYLVDHSAYGAMAFHVIEKSTGKSIFYTGDFRASGRKRKLFDQFIATPPKNVDRLLIEGTLIGREGGHYPDEEAVLKATIDVLCNTGTKVVFACCSGQNIDRIVTFYKAARRTKSLLVLDPYTACVLAAIKTEWNKIPQMDWDGMRVLIADYRGTGDIYVSKISKSRYSHLLGPLSRAKIKIQDFVNLDQKALVLMRGTMAPVIGRIAGIQNATLIYSQWSGYLKKEKENGPLRKFIKTYDIRLKHIHTSGHATEEHLRRLADAINPKAIIPVHTEHPSEYRKHFKNKVCCLKDGEIFPV